MEIQRTNNIQFGARYMGPAKVKSKVGTKWKDLEVSFIKFETVKQEDRKVLNNICRLWNRKNLSAGIAEEANILGSNAQIYALSKQKDFSGSVDPNQILGLMSTDKIQRGKDTVQIYKIGTTPEYAYAQKRRSRDIKHIASSLVDSFRAIAKKHGNKEVVVNYADQEDLKFLSKVGLELKNKNFIEVI